MWRRKDLFPDLSMTGTELNLGSSFSRSWLLLLFPFMVCKKRHVESTYCSFSHTWIITSLDEYCHWTQSYLADLIDHLLLFLGLLSKRQQTEIPIIKLPWLTLNCGNIFVQHQNTKLNKNKSNHKFKNLKIIII